MSAVAPNVTTMLPVRGAAAVPVAAAAEACAREGSGASGGDSDGCGGGANCVSGSGSGGACGSGGGGNGACACAGATGPGQQARPPSPQMWSRACPASRRNHSLADAQEPRFSSRFCLVAPRAGPKVTGRLSAAAASPQTRNRPQTTLLRRFGHGGGVLRHPPGSQLCEK